MLQQNKSLFLLDGYREFHVPICQSPVSFETNHSLVLTTTGGHLTNFPWKIGISFFSCMYMIWVLGMALGETGA